KSLSMINADLNNINTLQNASQWDKIKNDLDCNAARYFKKLLINTGIKESNYNTVILPLLQNIQSAIKNSDVQVDEDMDISKYIDALKGKEQSMQAKMAIDKVEATRLYNSKQKEYSANLKKYATNMGLLAKYTAEKNSMQQECALLKASLSSANLDLLSTLYDEANLDSETKSWSKVIISANEPKEFIRIVFLSQEIERLNELIVLYKGYTGQLTEQQVIDAGIKAEYILTKESLAEAGKDLKANDYSEKGEMLRQYKSIMQLAGRFTSLGSLATPKMNEIYNNALQLTAAIKDKMYNEAERLASISCDLKLNMVEVEKLRFEDKANYGLNGGIEEFNDQINNMQSMMTSWLSDMKEKLSEGDIKWKAKQVSFVTQRGEWIEKVRNKQAGQSDDEITALKQNLKELTGVIDVDMTEEKSKADKASSYIASSYIEQVAMPEWMTDYEIMANRLFGVLHKKDLPEDEALQVAVADLKTQMDTLDKEKKELELMQLIHELKIAQKQLEEQTSRLIKGYSENIGSILLGNGWTKGSGNYKRRYMQSYTLLGGEKKAEAVIDDFQSATKITDKVRSTKANVEKLESKQQQVSNPDLFTMDVYTEIERIKTVAVDLFGSENKAGKIWTEYIGRMPTGEESSEYIQQKSGANNKSLLARFTKCFADLFKGNKKDTQNEDKQEDLLTKSISSSKNKNLESGRIMLEFQNIESIEQQAIATRDGGFMNIPLFEGGPNLSTVGSIALGIVTGGASAAASFGASLAFQMGSGLVNIATASEQYRDAAGINMVKGMLTGCVSYGMGNLTSTFKAGLNLTNDLHGILTNSIIDASSSFATSTINSAINAFGPDGWNCDVFAGGLASGFLSSGSTLVGSTVSNGINVALGASWEKGGYNYTVAVDTIILLPMIKQTR
ncbi:MAG TPA: hypothetical protein PLI56_05160, partial [Exilispira sp.]|nr:hypothetical protein [Exilispira sp.]